MTYADEIKKKSDELFDLCREHEVPLIVCYDDDPDNHSVGVWGHKDAVGEMLLTLFNLYLVGPISNGE